MKVCRCCTHNEKNQFVYLFIIQICYNIYVMFMKKKNNNVFYKICSFILIISSLIFLGLLLYLNVLPFFYFIIFLVVALMIDLILWFLLVCPKIKKSVKFKSSIISVIIIVIYFIAGFYLFKTMDFLSKISNNVSGKVINYSVVVTNESKFSELADLKNKKIGYYEMNKQANNNIDLEASFNSYTDLNIMYKNLLSNKINALIIEDSLKSMLEEEDQDLLSSTRVIYTFSVKEEEDNTIKAVNTAKESFNLYISGIDTYGDIASVSRSDVNIIATINPKTRTILLTSIPRDYYVQLYGKTGYKDKLTHAGIYGVDTSINTIEELLSIDINYYIKVNFTSLIDIVDTLEGIDVYSDYSFTSIDGYKYSKGYNNMYGKKALSFARERHAFTDGDRQRGKNQEAVIKAIIAKATSPSIITKYDSLLTKVSSKMQTNMPQKDIMALVKNQLSDNKDWTIESNNLDGSNSFEYTYSYSSQKLYVMIPDQESIASAIQKIKEVSDSNGE